MTLQGKGVQFLDLVMYTLVPSTHLLSRTPLRYAPYSHRLVRGTLKQTGQLPSLSAVGRQVQRVLLIGVLDRAAFGQVPESERMSHRPELPLSSSLPLPPRPAAPLEVPSEAQSDVCRPVVQFALHLGSAWGTDSPQGSRAALYGCGDNVLGAVLADELHGQLQRPGQWVWSVGVASYPGPDWEACIFCPSPPSNGWGL